MKINYLFGFIVCSLLAFVACQEEGEMQPAPPKPVYKDTIFTYNITMNPMSTYDAIIQKIDSTAICDLFKISYTDFLAKLKDDKIKYYAVKADTTFDFTPPTANFNGHWFDGNGAVCTWGSGNGHLYSEFREEGFWFYIGQYPNICQAGENLTIRQAFVYAPDDFTNYLVVFIFNIAIVAP